MITFQYISPLSQPNLKINLTQNIYPIRRYGISQQKIHHVLPHLFVHRDPRSCAMQANSYATELVSFDTWRFFFATLRWSVGEFSSSWWFQPTSSSLKRETQKWNKTHMEHINPFEKYVCSQIGSWNPNLKGWKFQKVFELRPTGHAAFHPEKKKVQGFFLNTESYAERVLHWWFYRRIFEATVSEYPISMVNIPNGFMTITIKRITTGNQTPHGHMMTVEISGETTQTNSTSFTVNRQVMLGFLFPKHFEILWGLGWVPYCPISEQKTRDPIGSWKFWFS